jgi:hypothetical protein
MAAHPLSETRVCAVFERCVLHDRLPYDGISMLTLSSCAAVVNFKY